MNRQCTRCGGDVGSEPRFCPACGATISPSGAVSTPAPEVTGTIHALGTTTTDSGPLTPVEQLPAGLPSGSHFLVVAKGPSTGMTLELTESPTTAGRSADTAIFLDDITVSRTHAQFERAGHHWTLRDLGSLNGTYVNRHPIDLVELNSGDEIQIGKYRFRYVVGS